MGGEQSVVRNVDKRSSRREHRGTFEAAVVRYRAQSRLDIPEDDGKTSKHGEKGTTVDRSVRVCVRKRPFFDHEKKEGEFDVITCGERRVVIHDARMKPDMRHMFMNHTEFTFDDVFGDQVSSGEVYESTAKSLVEAVVAQGAHRTLMCYGQTGSGKTFTMTAIYERVAHDLFSLAASAGVTLSMSFVELLGDHCFDMLNAGAPCGLQSAADGSVHPYPCVEVAITDGSELQSLLQMAAKLRATAATGVHDGSSRSHACCRIFVQRQGDGGGNDSTVVEGSLTMLDLAGTEHRIDSAEHNAERQREGAKINASLAALKECIRATASHAKFVPFRRNRLTQLLRGCFSGSEQHETVIIATVSPSSKDTEHSLNTLRHACIMDGQGDGSSNSGSFVNGGKVTVESLGEIDVTRLGREMRAARKRGSEDDALDRLAKTPPAHQSKQSNLARRSMLDQKCLQKLPPSMLEALTKARATAGNERQMARLKVASTTENEDPDTTAAEEQILEEKWLKEAASGGVSKTFMATSDIITSPRVSDTVLPPEATKAKVTPRSVPMLPLGERSEKAAGSSPASELESSPLDGSTPRPRRWGASNSGKRDSTPPRIRPDSSNNNTSSNNNNNNNATNKSIDSAGTAGVGLAGVAAEGADVVSMGLTWSGLGSSAMSGQAFELENPRNSKENLENMGTLGTLASTEVEEPEAEADVAADGGNGEKGGVLPGPGAGLEAGEMSNNVNNVDRQSGRQAAPSEGGGQPDGNTDNHAEEPPFSTGRPVVKNSPRGSQPSGPKDPSPTPDVTEEDGEHQKAMELFGTFCSGGRYARDWRKNDLRLINTCVVPRLFGERAKIDWAHPSAGLDELERLVARKAAAESRQHPHHHPQHQHPTTTAGPPRRRPTGQGVAGVPPPPAASAASSAADRSPLGANRERDTTPKRRWGSGAVGRRSSGEESSLHLSSSTNGLGELPIRRLSGPGRSDPSSTASGESPQDQSSSAAENLAALAARRRNSSTQEENDSTRGQRGNIPAITSPRMAHEARNSGTTALPRPQSPGTRASLGASSSGDQDSSSHFSAPPEASKRPSQSNSTGPPTLPSAFRTSPRIPRERSETSVEAGNATRTTSAVTARSVQSAASGVSQVSFHSPDPSDMSAPSNPVSRSGPERPPDQEGEAELRRNPEDQPVPALRSRRSRELSPSSSARMEDFKSFTTASSSSFLPASRTPKVGVQEDELAGATTAPSPEGFAIASTSSSSSKDLRQRSQRESEEAMSLFRLFCCGGRGTTEWTSQELQLIDTHVVPQLFGCRARIEFSQPTTAVGQLQRLIFEHPMPSHIWHGAEGGERPSGGQTSNPSSSSTRNAPRTTPSRIPRPTAASAKVGARTPGSSTQASGSSSARTATEKVNSSRPSAQSPTLRTRTPTTTASSKQLPHTGPQGRSKSTTQLSSSNRIPMKDDRQSGRTGPTSQGLKLKRSEESITQAPSAPRPAPTQPSPRPIDEEHERTQAQLERQVSHKEMGVKQWLTALRAEMFKDSPSTLDEEEQS